jgi:hypothetical protein
MLTWKKVPLLKLIDQHTVICLDCRYDSRRMSLTIGDLSQKEVSDYLKMMGLKDTVDPEFGSLYSRLFELVGGRMIRLEKALWCFKEGKNFQSKL